MEICLTICLISSIPGLCPADRVLVGDKVVGAYLTLCPEYSFVCESSVDGSIVAFAVSAPDAKKLFTRYVGFFKHAAPLTQFNVRPSSGIPWHGCPRCG